MRHSNCEICGKPLSNFVSVKIGIGPVCRGKEKIQPGLPFENHAGFEVITENDQFIYLEDTGHNQFKTVTTDANYVLTSLAEQFGLENKRVFYKDSYGEIDEILHKNGILAGYKHGHTGYTVDMVLGKIPPQKPVKKKRRSADYDFGM
jgi:hypothetical protein